MFSIISETFQLNLNICFFLRSVNYILVAMPRQAFTKQRMQAIARESLATYHRTHSGDAVTKLNDLVCEYEGVKQNDGTYYLDVRVTAHSIVAFRWHTSFNGSQFSMKEIRADRASKNGVPFPAAWHQAPQCCIFESWIDACAIKAKDALDLTSLGHRLLGQPKRCTLPETSNPLTPGAIIQLCLGSANVEFLLCAHVHEDLWLCTRGHFVGDVLQGCDPFAEDSIELKNIEQEAWHSDAEAKRVRTPPHLRHGQLYELASSQTERWDLAVAVATWYPTC